MPETPNRPSVAVGWPALPGTWRWPCWSTPLHSRRVYLLFSGHLARNLDFVVAATIVPRYLPYVDVAQTTKKENQCPNNLLVLVFNGQGLQATLIWRKWTCGSCTVRSPQVGHAGLQHDHAVHVYVATRDRFGALLGIGVGPRVSVALAVAAKHRAAPGRASHRRPLHGPAVHGTAHRLYVVRILDPVDDGRNASCRLCSDSIYYT